MENEKKKGWLGKLFESKKSSCCSIRIVEVTDESQKENASEEKHQHDSQQPMGETAENKEG